MAFIGILGAVIALTMMLTPACAHETHTHMKPMGKMEETGGSEFLYGKNRNSESNELINCCKHGGDGDCHLVKQEKVKLVPGGYQLEDGEFIKEEETTVSPDENYYRCQHVYDGQALPSHCFFVPPRGF